MKGRKKKEEKRRKEGKNERSATIVGENSRLGSISLISDERELGREGIQIFAGVC